MLEAERSLGEGWLEDHGDFLLAYAKRKGADRAISEDLVQETLLAALQSYPRFRGESSVRTWLCSILRYKLADHFRRIKREMPVEGLLQHVQRLARGPYPPRTLEQELQARLAGGIIQVCLDSLSPRARSLFLLAEIQGFSPRELADASQLGAGNVRLILHRVRRKLRGCLLHGGVSTP